MGLTFNSCLSILSLHYNCLQFPSVCLFSFYAWRSPRNVVPREVCPSIGVRSEKAGRNDGELGHHSNRESDKHVMLTILVALPYSRYLCCQGRFYLTQTTVSTSTAEARPIIMEIREFHSASHRQEGLYCGTARWLIIGRLVLLYYDCLSWMRVSDWDKMHVR